MLVFVMVNNVGMIDFFCEFLVCLSELDWEGLNIGSGKFNLRIRGSNDSFYNIV